MKWISLIVLINVVIIEDAYCRNERLYFALIFTISLLVIALVNMRRKAMYFRNRKN